MNQQGGEERRFRFHPDAHGQYSAGWETSVAGAMQKSGY